MDDGSSAGGHFLQVPGARSLQNAAAMGESTSGISGCIAALLVVTGLACSTRAPALAQEMPGDGRVSRDGSVSGDGGMDGGTAVDGALPHRATRAEDARKRDLLGPTRTSTPGTCPLGVSVQRHPRDARPRRPGGRHRIRRRLHHGRSAAPERCVRGRRTSIGRRNWKSTDSGFTHGRPIQSANERNTTTLGRRTTPATLYPPPGSNGKLQKSTDGGQTFTLVGPGNLAADFYSLKVNPYDTNHLISGLHEVDGLVESTDGGNTWTAVGGAGWPTGGISWFPFFLDTGDAASTRGTWFAMAQDGASAVMTSNSGANWTIPSGLSGLQHPHGNCQIYQNGSNVFVGGLYGPGQGVYRSTDLGLTWSRVDSGQFPEAVVFGTAKNVYAMWSWACSGCNLGADTRGRAAAGRGVVDGARQRDDRARDRTQQRCGLLRRLPLRGRRRLLVAGTLALRRAVTTLQRRRFKRANRGLVHPRASARARVASAQQRKPVSVPL